MNVGRKILMIAGKAGSGKDAVANYLVKRYGYKRYAFADALKLDVAKKYNVDVNILHTQEGKKKEIKLKSGRLMSLREILINEAYHARILNQDIYADIINKEIFDDDSEKIVISDFRFPNEYYNLYSSYGDSVSTIYITRTHNDIPEIDDASETSLEKFLFDYNVLNDSDKYKLHVDVDKILKSMLNE